MYGTVGTSIILIMPINIKYMFRFRYTWMKFYLYILSTLIYRHDVYNAIYIPYLIIDSFTEIKET